MLKVLKRWFGIDSVPETPERTGAQNAALPTANGAPVIVKAAPRKNGNTADVPPNPRLSLERPHADDGFDPYNTGAFNRSQSWERIGRKKR